MKRIAYNGRAWFGIWRIATWTVDFRSGRVIPDKYGATLRRVKIGPYATAQDALRRA